MCQSDIVPYGRNCDVAMPRVTIDVKSLNVIPIFVILS